MFRSYISILFGLALLVIPLNPEEKKTRRLLPCFLSLAGKDLNLSQRPMGFLPENKPESDFDCHPRAGLEPAPLGKTQRSTLLIHREFGYPVPHVLNKLSSSVRPGVVYSSPTSATLLTLPTT